MIYFDNAATTPAFDDLVESCFNPSSPHGLGRKAERALMAAREEMAGVLGCSAGEIVFTSGGTESNNLALLGFALANRRRGVEIFTEPWEHPSVTEAVKHAHEMGYAEGRIAPFDVLVKPSLGCRIVSFSQICHETGSRRDVGEMARALKRTNPETIIHVDAAQGFCKELLPIDDLDLVSFSGHKIHAGFGVGGLFVKKGIRLKPIFHGGSQENGLRAGTENMGGILRMAHAAKILSADMEKNRAHVARVKAELACVVDELPDCFVNSQGDASPYILNISFIGIKGETLVHLLSEKEIYASMGAACRSRKKTKSMLEVMGFSAERATAAVRFSFSHMNTVDEAAQAKEVIIKHVAQMRRVLGKKIRD
jgi:cysteine desulfurase